MHAMTPYALRSYKGRNDQKKFEYHNLDNVNNVDLLELIYDFMKEKSAHVYLYEKEKRVFKFTDIDYDKNNRTVSGFLVAGYYGVKSDIVDVVTGEVRFPKSEKDAEVLRHFVMFTIPPNATEGLALLHKSRGVGIKTLFEGLFKPVFSKKTQFSLQMDPYAHTDAVKDWVNGARVKSLRVQGYVPSSDIAEELKNMGNCNTEFIIRPKTEKKGIVASFGALKDFYCFDDPKSEQNPIVSIFSKVGAKVSATAELNGKRRTFEVGVNKGGVACDIPFEDEAGNSQVELIGEQPELQSVKDWSKELVNDILKGMFGKKAFQLKL